MQDLILVNIRHETLGRCNPEELLHVIKKINPQVIFEERRPSHYDDYYISKSKSSLESDALNLYIQDHEFQHVPVDLDEEPPKNLVRDHLDMLKKINGMITPEAQNFKVQTDYNKRYSEVYGFDYLNHENGIKMHKAIQDAIKGALQQRNDDNLNRISDVWDIFHSRREDHMLQGIYDYSKMHDYDRAIFIVGSGHRSSIIEKVSQFNNSQSIKLNLILDLDQELT